MVKKKLSTRKKKKKINLPFGKLYVKAGGNNTIITLTDEKGNKISWGGTGQAGFDWAKQATPYAAEEFTKQLLGEAKDLFGLKEVAIIAKGVWYWRDWVFKAINDLWEIKIRYISEKTPIQFGGCRGVKR